jgi:integrase/recombinase XerC
LGILSEWIGDPDLLEGVEQQGQVRGSTKHRSLTGDEYHRLVHILEQNTKRTVTQFEYLNAVRDWASVMLMLHGLRVEECSLVDVDDITLNERSGYVLVRNGKGSKERTVPLNLIARNALRLFLDLRPASASNNLFAITTRTLQRNVAQLGTQIGVPDITPHWMRYTFSKRLEINGTPLEAIRDLLGHNSIETTRRYLRSSLDELTSAVEGVM